MRTLLMVIDVLICSVLVFLTFKGWLERKASSCSWIRFTTAVVSALWLGMFVIALINFIMGNNDISELYEFGRPVLTITLGVMLAGVITTIKGGKL